MTHPPEHLRLTCVVAHADDESARQGWHPVALLSSGCQHACRDRDTGERGRFGDAKTSHGFATVGTVREGELCAAALEFGVTDVRLLGYVDGDLDQADPAEAFTRIVTQLRRVQPQVVITFDPYWAYGHPDHIAICQLTTAAVSVSANPDFESDDDGAATHAVSKLYYMAWSPKKWKAYQAVLKTLTSRVDGVERQAQPWPESAVTTVIDTSDCWETTWRAVSCHQTQDYYRVFSTVNGGGARETDLFEGLR